MTNSSTADGEAVKEEYSDLKEQGDGSKSRLKGEGWSIDKIS